MITTHDRALASEIAGTSSCDDRHYCLFDTAIGACGVAWSERGLTRLQLPEVDRRATERRLRANVAKASKSVPTEINQLIANIQDYMTGRSVAFATMAIDLTDVGAFERMVYQAARSVPWGHTVTYGELARQIGSPGAARAVGHALSRNPVPIIIPCHRVLAKGRRIGGFSAHGGTLAKERLLALEGVRVDAGTPLLPGII